MIESVRFKNFKVLRDTTLPLSQVTVVVGANGSGKTTALSALQAIASQTNLPESARSVGVPSNEDIEVEVNWGAPRAGTSLKQTWRPALGVGRAHVNVGGGVLAAAEQSRAEEEIKGFRVYSFDSAAIAKAVALSPTIELGSNGANLAGVLERMRDLHPEKFEALNNELARWFPEFDRVLFDMPTSGTKSVLLRFAKSRHSVPAAHLSEGTLFGLALLTISYLPSPPTIVGLEEPDRAIHPRLLRDVQDAIYRLAHPDTALDPRKPVQVVATTHSPYFLSLFRDRPEEVVIAEKNNLEATFHRLSDRSDIDEILQDAPLGDVWYSGILGGVPARS